MGKFFLEKKINLDTLGMNSQLEHHKPLALVFTPVATPLLPHTHAHACHNSLVQTCTSSFFSHVQCLGKLVFQCWIVTRCTIWVTSQFQALVEQFYWQWNDESLCGHYSAGTYAHVHTHTHKHTNDNLQSFHFTMFPSQAWTATYKHTHTHMHKLSSHKSMHIFVTTTNLLLGIPIISNSLTVPVQGIPCQHQTTAQSRER